MVGVSGSNPAKDMDVLLCLLCVVSVAVSATSLSFVQRCPTGGVCVCVFVCVCARLCVCICVCV